MTNFRKKTIGILILGINLDRIYHYFNLLFKLKAKITKKLSSCSLLI